jgi:formylglycine-generating enzyme
MNNSIRALVGASILGLAIRTFACGGGAVSPDPSELTVDATVATNDASILEAAVPVDAQVDSGIPLLGPPAYDLRGCKHQPVNADCKDGWCKIPAGCYVAGSPETEFGRGLISEPEVVITLTNSFVVQQTEVTQAQWQMLGLRDPSPFGNYPDGVACISDDCPVTNVSWLEALAYANKLSEKHGLPLCYELPGCTGKPGEEFSCQDSNLTTSRTYDCRGYRLPMVAEWEYAARAGTRTPYYSEIEPQRIEDCHDEPALNEIAWYCWNAFTKPGQPPNTTMPVRQKKPNRWGLFDMLGNVGEWNYDHVRGNNYGERDVIDPPDFGTKGDGSRTIRGGLENSKPVFLRASNLFGSGRLNDRGAGIGFRLVRTIFP